MSYKVAGPNWKRIWVKTEDGLLCQARIRLRDGTDYCVWADQWRGRNTLGEGAFDPDNITVPQTTTFPTYKEAAAAWEKRMAELEKEHNIHYQIIEVNPVPEEVTDED